MDSEEEEKYCTNCKRSVAAHNFASHSAFCERNIFVCKTCKEPVGISEKDEHFDNYHVISPCNLCEASIEKWMLPDHMEICPKRLIVCEFCEAEFPLNEHTEHVEFCGSRTEKCLLCKKYIMMKDKDKHTELHRCEQRYNKKKIEEEIKQNKVNEVISCLGTGTVRKSNSEDSTEDKFLKRREETRKGDPKARIGTNFEGMEESAFNKTSCDSKRMEQDHRMQSLQGATALPDRAKEKSSRYGECHICKQSIPWIDMNTHIPSCASLAGKCSLCGKDVPNHAMKDHMREHLSGNFQMESMRVPESPVSHRKKNSSDHEQNNSAKLTPHFDDKHTVGMKSSSINEYQCPLCFGMVPRKDKHRHERDCQIVQDNTKLDSTYFSRSLSQSFYECPLCSEKVPEECRQTHLSFECKMLLENSGPCDTSGRTSDCSNIYECPLCLDLMQEKDKKKHELFECKILIDNSGVQIPEPELDTNSTKKTCQCSCRKRTNNCKCKSNPQLKMPDNQKYSSQRKVPCDHCKEMFPLSFLDIHEKYCPALKSKKYSSKHETQDVQNFKGSNYEHKGAVPKKTSIREMMLPAIGKCIYCHTTLNVDILKYHEDECIHRPVDCPECQKSIPMKDLGNHECRKKKRKDMKPKGDRQVPEEKTQSGFVNCVMNYFKAPSHKDKDEKEITKRQDLYSLNSQSYPNYQHVSNTEERNQPLYFNDANFMVPCEFCNKGVLASDLVLHETGCKPDLVSFAKQEPSGSPNMDKSSAKYDSVPSNTKFNKTNVGGVQQPFFPENSNLTADRMKHERKSNSQPGEFLQFKYEKSSSRNYDGIGNESKGKKEEYCSFQSVWNIGSYSDNGTEDHSDQISKHLEDPMDVDKFNEPSTINSRTMKHGNEFVRQTSDEMISEDGDMNAILCFLSDDKEYETESEAKKKRAKFINPKFDSYSALDSNLLKEHLLQKNHEDCSDERNTNIERESSRLFKENLRSVAHSRNNEVEMRAAIQQLKDLQSDASAAITYNQIPIETNSTLEKKDEEPEISSKQKILLDASTESNKGLNDDFKKYLPDLKFGSPKEKPSSADGENDELCTKDDERCEKLLEKHINKMSVYDRLSSKEECADSLKSQTSFKFGTYHSSASCYEKNVCKTMEDEKLTKQCYKSISTHANYSEDSGENINDLKNCIPDLEYTTHEKSDIIQECNRLLSENKEEKYNELQANYITDISKHVWNVKNDRKLASNSFNLTDSEIAHLKSERCSLQNAEHETLLQKNIADESVIPNMEKSARDTANENKCISNYKKYFPDLKFAATVKSPLSKEDSIHHTVPSKKNLMGPTEKLYEQQLKKTSTYSDCSENERESANSFNPLTNVKYASFKSTVLPCNNETNQRKLHVKRDEEPDKLHLDKTFTYTDNTSKSEEESSNDFKKYLPDFKFGSQITSSSKNKTCFANLSDKKGHLEESAFKLESAAQLTSNKSVDVHEDSMKKIKDLEARIANIKKQVIETENRAEWRQWRDTLNSKSSDSE